MARIPIPNTNSGQPLPATPKTKRTFPVTVILSVLLLTALAVASYFYYQYRQSSQVKDVKETEELVVTLGKIMELPEGEKPTLATVTDKEKLAEQAFFQKAENGDKVLIYSQSGRAILYRPSTKKIIDVTSVNVAAPQTQATEPVPEPEAALVIVRVAILNGSQTVGATNTVESQLKPVFPNIAVVTKANAKKDYTETIVIDVTGKNEDMAKEIASTLKGSVASLPSGETAPTDADLLIIYGSPTSPAPTDSSAGTQTNPKP